MTNLDFVKYGQTYSSKSKSPRKDKTKMWEQISQMPTPALRNYFFRNNRDLSFSDSSAAWGITKAMVSNGAIYADLDNDGDLDLVINNIDEPAAVYENRSNVIHPGTNWIKVKCKGPNGNRDGFEAKVWLWQNGMLQFNFVAPVRGYISSVPAMLHFGLADKPVDSLKILWPDGKQQVVKQPKVNSLLVLDYADAIASGAAAFDVKEPKYITEVDSILNINYQHQEDEYVDFKAQPILAHKRSHEGPGIASGDVNNDGLDDFFVGAGSGYNGSFFIQESNGKFVEKVLQPSSHADDMGALLFDADNDKDLDLYVVSGGTSTEKKGNPIYQDRLYLNNGHGDFTIAPDVLPNTAIAEPVLPRPILIKTAKPI